MIDVTLIQYILAIISGIAVGFSLGLIGGGGSILAVPLFIYFVGINHPHLAIGTTALAVGITAYINFAQHLRKKNANIKLGGVFALVGIVGVLIGSTIGLIIKGGELLFFFSMLMIIIGIYMYISKCRAVPNEDCKELAKQTNYGKVSGYSLIVGFASGFFGIGGGFLIVPGLLASSKIKINMAIGTSLLAVGTFGIVTAIRYSIVAPGLQFISSGMIGDVLFLVAIVYVIGGIFGGYLGTKLSVNLGGRKGTLRKVFSIIIILVGIYVAYESYPALVHMLFIL
ncbi:sulfite exporter TauE/SafE family protein [Ferroplasma acidiphilum]|uniref:Probable membrane transporter protein n=1 Tax=Ferroplasma acidiphilum TaxID=74969 RepID=A0A7K4FMV5_9ARCH|nr:sulfite exporter TauE/SafE family protein [Ferroplasma acidiphilum]NOL60346.1 sulfite exporter TauE/SafE family protein [Ferroplasma acidiphilum]